MSASLYKKLFLILSFASVSLLVFIFGFLLGQKNNSFQVLSEKAFENEAALDRNTRSPDFINEQIDEKEFQENRYLVTKVIDGDTINVLINGKSETLRLIGVDTPETVDPRKPIQCFGKEASDKARSLLLGKNVLLESDPTQGERDRYQRLLRYVFLENGENFNLIMIRDGFAHEYTYNTPYKYQAEFVAAEKFAQENNLGLWSPNACDSSLNSNDPGPLDTTVQTSNFSCNCSKLCGQIATCDEAYYQLNSCGCSARDADGDGVPCETLCR